MGTGCGDHGIANDDDDDDDDWPTVEEILNTHNGGSAMKGSSPDHTVNDDDEEHWSTVDEIWIPRYTMRALR